VIAACVLKENEIKMVGILKSELPLHGSGDAKKMSSNDSFGKNVAKYSKLGQIERFLLHWVGLGTL
jgi:hypothetical protein